LGIDRVIRLPLRDNKMDTDALASCLATMNHEKRQVMAVVATVGCSGTGAFDDIDTIGQLCETHDVWLHVDGAHGATALLSQAHKHRLKGLERAQSVTWDLHKMLLMPLPASVLLVRDQADLLHAFYPEAKADKQYWNLGKYSFMASRRADALKVWVAFQRYGADGLGAIYEYLCHLAQVTCALVRARPDFELAHEPDCNVVCFRYIGTPSKRAPDEIAQINQAIHDRIDHFGESMIARAFIDDLVVLRTTYMNPFTKEHHVAEILDEIAKVGRDLERESSPSV
ncbi:MAG: pyridoxal-dependent decarboxylase, partial [Myxococcota bacterium]